MAPPRKIRRVFKGSSPEKEQSVKAVEKDVIVVKSKEGKKSSSAMLGSWIGRHATAFRKTSNTSSAPSSDNSQQDPILENDRTLQETDSGVQNKSSVTGEMILELRRQESLASVIPLRKIKLKKRSSDSGLGTSSLSLLQQNEDSTSSTQMADSSVNKQQLDYMIVNRAQLKSVSQSSESDTEQRKLNTSTQEMSYTNHSKPNTLSMVPPPSSLRVSKPVSCVTPLETVVHSTPEQQVSPPGETSAGEVTPAVSAVSLDVVSRSGNLLATTSDQQETSKISHSFHAERKRLSSVTSSKR